MLLLLTVYCEHDLISTFWKLERTISANRRRTHSVLVTVTVLLQYDTLSTGRTDSLWVDVGWINQSSVILSSRDPTFADATDRKIAYRRPWSAGRRLWVLSDAVVSQSEVIPGLCGTAGEEEEERTHPPTDHMRHIGNFLELAIVLPAAAATACVRVLSLCTRSGPYYTALMMMVSGPGIAARRPRPRQ